MAVDNYSGMVCVTDLGTPEIGCSNLNVTNLLS